MVSDQARKAYRQTSAQVDVNPVKLIHLMYERVLVHLKEAEAGIFEKNPQKRGENLGKAIAIITELNASVKQEDDSEAAVFLRGLYSAILVELPKVSATNDREILRKSFRYIERLKEIWEETAMKEEGLAKSQEERESAGQEDPSSEAVEPLARSKERHHHGLSVSI